MADPLHDDEVLIDPSVARRLVDDQFPDWAALPLRPVSEFGTDHVLFRLGDELVVRFPRSEFGEEQLASDGQWLPHLAEHLPVALPEQVAVGQPGDGYPLRWSVVRWLPGAAPDPGSVGSTSVARDLGGFVTALRAGNAPAMTQCEPENDRGGGGGAVDDETMDEAEENRERLGGEGNLDDPGPDPDEPWAKTSSGDTDSP